MRIFFIFFLHRCYSVYDRCDGQLFCDDGTDESDCTLQDCRFPYERKFCPVDRVCVRKTHQCPTHQDFSCPVHQPIRCKDYSGCYATEEICDGIIHCSDKSDEKYCETQTMAPPTTPDLTTSLTTLLGILGCIPIFAMFLCLHKFCENKILQLKPRILQSTNNNNEVPSPVHNTALQSNMLPPELHGPIQLRGVPLGSGLCRTGSCPNFASNTHTHIVQTHNVIGSSCAPADSTHRSHTHMAQMPYGPMQESFAYMQQGMPTRSDTDYSLDAPPPYSSCGPAPPAHLSLDLPPSYEEAIATHTLVIQRESSAFSFANRPHVMHESMRPPNLGELISPTSSNSNYSQRRLTSHREGSLSRTPSLVRMPASMFHISPSLSPTLLSPSLPDVVAGSTNMPRIRSPTQDRLGYPGSCQQGVHRLAQPTSPTEGSHGAGYSGLMSGSHQDPDSDGSLLIRLHF